MRTKFYSLLTGLEEEHGKLLKQKNEKADAGNGIFDRYENPVLTARHTAILTSWSGSGSTRY
jgi:4-O-beta-D-mannosyl-D-glucose phosphorylase